MDDVDARAKTAVSVIIPTIGRTELARAVGSAASQRGVDVEVIVVVDAAEGDVVLGPEVHAQARRVLWTGGGAGGSQARNLGVEVAAGEFVAFLDDDDEWTSDKLARQIDYLSGCALDDVVVSSRIVHRSVADGRLSAEMPKRIIEEGQRVAHYLFRKRRPAGGRASIYTSTLLCATDLARRVPWDAGLTRHQDWDWLIRAERSGAHVRQVPEALVFIQTGSVGSISASSRWAPSLAWAEKTFADDRQTRADFLAGQTLRYALGARSFTGVRRTLRALIAGRRLPAMGPALIGLGGLIPRRGIEMIMSRTK